MNEKGCSLRNFLPPQPAFRHILHFFSVFAFFIYRTCPAVSFPIPCTFRLFSRRLIPVLLCPSFSFFFSRPPAPSLLPSLFCVPPFFSLSHHMSFCLSSVFPFLLPFFRYHPGCFINHCQSQSRLSFRVVISSCRFELSFRVVISSCHFELSFRATVGSREIYNRPCQVEHFFPTWHSCKN